MVTFRKSFPTFGMLFQQLRLLFCTSGNWLCKGFTTSVGCERQMFHLILKFCYFGAETQNFYRMETSLRRIKDCQTWYKNILRHVYSSLIGVRYRGKVAGSKLPMKTLFLTRKHPSPKTLDSETFWRTH